jgi:hypothetical protein
MPVTDFTYSAYIQLIQLIIENGYTITDYHHFDEVVNPCILRHDIDFDIAKALDLARIEAVGLPDRKVQSTYFVLLNTDFYNVFSKTVYTMLKEMVGLGHTIGLHFDETKYFYSDTLPWDLMVQSIQKEIYLLEQIIEQPVRAVSMHRPSKITREAELVIPGVVNSYSQLFFQEFKYLSDSHHTWRENAEGIVSSGGYRMLHVLTHPFWYTESVETCRDKLFKFISTGNRARYNKVDNNFRNLDEYVRQEELM